MRSIEALGPVVALEEGIAVGLPDESITEIINVKRIEFQIRALLPSEN
jgi:hypothetical protein